MKHVLVFLYFLFLSLSANSQKLLKVIKKNNNSPVIEEYFVLKEDSTVKHGVYIKYLERLSFQKFVWEFGTFDHNLKTGTWCKFDITHPQNPLNIVGEYSNGEKNGQWLYFYPPELKEGSMLGLLLGNKMLTTIIEPKGKNQEYELAIDTTGIKLAATGTYKESLKSGVWSYYSKYGDLIKEYDFSDNKYVYNFQNDSVSFYLLGGINQFERQLGQIFIEKNAKLSSFKPSDLEFEIITHENTIYVNNLKTIINDPFSEYIEDQIKKMPLDWIDFDPFLERSSFIFKINFTKEENNTVVKLKSSRSKFDKD